MNGLTTISREHADGLIQVLEEDKAKSPQAVFGILAGWVLRHSARSLGYHIAPDGFVRVSDILRFPPFRHFGAQLFAKMIYNDPKDRFEMSFLPDLVEGQLEDVWWVRARHMHSIPGVSATSKRILKMVKLQTVAYRTRPQNWDYIRQYGIPEGPDHLIRLHKKGGANIFKDNIPDQETYLCVTIDCEKAAELGVTFYHTNDVKLYAVGNHDGVIPLEACRSALLLDISKEKLK
ncbi:KptA family-domain-containing protein [Flammula alnicola]|nr:KptA family-domain-containing protein [Flammula alnicola]